MPDKALSSTSHGRALRILADGHSHSGEELAAALGVTRAAVWKQVSKLGDWGLNIEATRGQGYVLDPPIEFLSEKAIRSKISDAGRGLLEALVVAEEIESTNQALMEAGPPSAGALNICLAEYQRAGRGRRGRNWIAPFGSGLCLSAGWAFDEMPKDLSALTLATGLVIRRTLRETVGVGIKLKWPNDLIWGDRKLGGILVELKAESQGSCFIVIGMGLNVSSFPAQLEAESQWSNGAVDLGTATEGRPPSRNSLAASLIDSLGGMLQSYSSSGFAAYRDEFDEADYLRGRHVSVLDAVDSINGIASGIDADGALRLNMGDAVKRIIAGDVSVRMVA